MRIAILSQNNVHNDSRILKELRSLEATFSDIVVFGIDNKKSNSAVFLPSSHSPLYLNTRTKNIDKRVVNDQKYQDPRLDTYMIAKRILKLGTVLFAILSILSFLYSFFTTFSLIYALSFVILSVSSQLGYTRVKKLGRKRTKRLVSNAFNDLKSGKIDETMARKIIRMRTSYALVDAVIEESQRGGPFDVIHGHDLAGLEAGMMLKASLGGKLIWDAHEFYEDVANAAPEYSVAASALIAEASPHVDELICINESVAKAYRQRYPRLPKAHIIMNATLRSDIPPRDWRLRDKLGIARTQRVLLFHGGLAPARGLEILVRAAALFPANWTLVFLGRGKLEQQLRDLACVVNDTVGTERVLFLPFVPHEDLLLWASGADVGIIPYENVCLNHMFCTPNKLWEFPGSGVPLIAPAYTEIKPLVERYDIGWLLPTDFDGKSIADVIASITDEDLQRKSANTKRFLDEMSWERFEPVLNAIYEDIARRGNDDRRQKSEMARPATA